MTLRNRVIRVQTGSLGWALIQGDGCSYTKEELWTQTARAEHREVTETGGSNTAASQEPTRD